MWTDLLENNKMVKGVYGTSEPDLNNVNVMEIAVNPSCLSMRVQLLDVPNPLPKRWAERGFDSCTCRFSFYNADENSSIFRLANLNVNNFNNMSIAISALQNEKKYVVVKDVNGVSFVEAEVESIQMFELVPCAE